MVWCRELAQCRRHRRVDCLDTSGLCMGEQCSFTLDQAGNTGKSEGEFSYCQIAGPARYSHGAGDSERQSACAALGGN